MIFKKIGSLCFGLAFLAAIIVFTDYGINYISKNDARTAIVILGSIALLMNLLSFKYDNQSENTNLIFWVGTVIVFVGLVMKMQGFDFNQFVLLIGLVVIGLSYFYNPFKNNEKDKKNDLLDQ
jgi:hypothetical protein